MLRPSPGAATPSSSRVIRMDVLSMKSSVTGASAGSMLDKSAVLLPSSSRYCGPSAPLSSRSHAVEHDDQAAGCSSGGSVAIQAPTAFQSTYGSPLTYLIRAASGKSGASSSCPVGSSLCRPERASGAVSSGVGDRKSLNMLSTGGPPDTAGTA